MITIFLLSILTSCQMNTDTVNQTKPTKRSEIASTLYQNKMYVAGGINFWGSCNRFEVYDIATQKWESLPNLPKKLNHIGVVAHQDTVYISGGFFNAIQTKFSNVLYGYSINDKQWHTITTMPDNRGAHFMICKDDQLHLIGGRNHTAVWTFDLTTREWSTDKITPLPEKRDHISVLQGDNKLYIVGGRQSGLVKKDCWEYDFDTKQWRVFASLPSPRGGQSACIYKGQIHVAGGEDLQESITYSRHDIYNIAEQKWIKGNDLKIARHGFISELSGNQWYIFGGGKKAGFKTLFSTTADLEMIAL